MILYWTMRVIKKLSEPKVLLFLGVLYTLFLLLASVSPTSDLPKIDFPFLDKIIHVLLYMALAVIWLLFEYMGNKARISLKTMVLVLVFCFIYGIIIEVIQDQFTAFRKADPMDALANLVGVLVGWMVFVGAKKLVKPYA